MQAKTIVKFIFSIIASLALLSIIFPNDGIPFFGTKLKFPSIAEVIKTPVDSALIGEAPKDVINKRKSDLDIAKKMSLEVSVRLIRQDFLCPIMMLHILIIYLKH